MRGILSNRGVSHLLLPFVLACVSCTPAMPGPPAPVDEAGLLPLWQVTDGERSLYILGSIHMLRPETYPLDDAIYAAFDASDVIAYEIDLSQMAAAAPLMLARGFYQDGRRLQDVLPGEVYADLSEHFGELGLPLQPFAAAKPWFMAITLSALVMQQGGYEGAHGVDMHFLERTQKAGKQIVALETMEEQLDVFEGLTDEEQVTMLRSTLDELDAGTGMLDEMTDMWQRGDVDGIAAMTTESMEGQPNLEKRILHDRNERWVPQIEQLLQSGRPAMVIVGLAHLAGRGSVIDLLRARGHEVTRVKSASVTR